MALVASLVHVTDMHLFVDSAGNECSPDEARGLIRALHGRGQKGLERHNNVSWASLQRRLPEIVADERHAVGEGQPVLVVQTGDVEAYGIRNAATAFPGFTALQGDLWREVHRAGATAC